MKKPSGGLATARDRMARMRERQSQQGMKRVEVTVPETRADEIRQIAATMRQEHEMNGYKNAASYANAEAKKRGIYQLPSWKQRSEADELAMELGIADCVEWCDSTRTIDGVEHKNPDYGFVLR
jgi:hypothetical protein